jgi:hypothetical protein
METSSTRSHKVPGSAGALARCRVRPRARPIKKTTGLRPHSFQSTREGACWNARGRACSPGPGAAAPLQGRGHGRRSPVECEAYSTGLGRVRRWRGNLIDEEPRPAPFTGETPVPLSLALPRHHFYPRPVTRHPPRPHSGLLPPPSVLSSQSSARPARPKTPATSRPPSPIPRAAPRTAHPPATPPPPPAPRHPPPGARPLRAGSPP